MPDGDERVALNVARCLRLCRQKVQSAMRHATTGRKFKMLEPLAALEDAVEGTIKTLELPRDSSVGRRKAKKATNTGGTK